jgi:dTDP-4-amino-4,6-dideoxygalactose transaminase
VTVASIGINAKLSEVAAAFGLLQLKYMDQLLRNRRVIEARYRQALAEVPGIRCPVEINPTGSNSSYLPILVSEPYPLSRDALYQKMRTCDVHARRYFYPLISDLPMYRNMHSAPRSNLPTAARVADQILCLPIYPSLQESDQTHILALIRNA